MIVVYHDKEVNGILKAYILYGKKENNYRNGYIVPTFRNSRFYI